MKHLKNRVSGEPNIENTVKKKATNIEGMILFVGRIFLMRQNWTIH